MAGRARIGAPCLSLIHVEVDGAGLYRAGGLIPGKKRQGVGARLDREAVPGAKLAGNSEIPEIRNRLVADVCNPPDYVMFP